MGREREAVRAGSDDCDVDRLLGHGEFFEQEKFIVRDSVIEVRLGACWMWGPQTTDCRTVATAGVSEKSGGTWFDF